MVKLNVVQIVQLSVLLLEVIHVVEELLGLLLVDFSLAKFGYVLLFYYVEFVCFLFVVLAEFVNFLL